MNTDPYQAARRTMVARQIQGRGIEDERVLAAMATVERHRFVPRDHWRLAYDDSALPLAHDQTISQPYMVAAMTEALLLRPESRVLEIGTGSGYQTAILAELVREVYTIERLPELAEAARAILRSMGYANIHFRVGDGSKGWPEEAPYDGIMVTAAAGRIPPPLVEQLADGGHLVIPVGGPYDQDLYQIERRGRAYEQKLITRCRFVPLVEEPEGR